MGVGVKVGVGDGMGVGEDVGTGVAVAVGGTDVGVKVGGGVKVSVGVASSFTAIAVPVDGATVRCLCGLHPKSANPVSSRKTNPIANHTARAPFVFLIRRLPLANLSIAHLPQGRV